MRLWHKSLIKFLPRTQLLALWRELNTIYVNQPNHILINYIYNYDKEYLFNYSKLVIGEMQNRGYKISEKSWKNFSEYFGDVGQYKDSSKMFEEHDDEYLSICCNNLFEKYLRGQKDFSTKEWELIDALEYDVLTYQAYQQHKRKYQINGGND